MTDFVGIGTDVGPPSTCGGLRLTGSAQIVFPISRTFAPLYGTAMTRPVSARTPPDHEKFPEPIEEPRREIAFVTGSNSSTDELRQGMP